MNIILRNLSLTFDLESETPFFQVSIPHRIRFDADMISKPLVTTIVNQLFDTPDTTHCSFLSKYLSPIHAREKTRVVRFFNIINWREDVHVGEDTYIISTFYKLTNEALIDYLLYVPRSFINPYIIFYNNHHIVYISSDVLDVISCSEEVIKNYKAKYADIMDIDYE
ncbi:phage tail protein [Staphylococcus agnetis]|uniref:phage tail protein n=1 Tax=Staphylococcus agnetis TaxID=985762 RepID=UPI00118C8CFF|nr:phage tail protein [Staphylococcus agnetis]QDW97717.1 phage tail protein [Staphylococcus agnetis]